VGYTLHLITRSFCYCGFDVKKQASTSRKSAKTSLADTVEAFAKSRSDFVIHGRKRIVITTYNR